MSYAQVCVVLEQITSTNSYGMNDDVRMGLRHYAEMLRRYVVAESEISDLCRRIYEQHREALDLIYEHRPDRQSFVHELLERFITDNPELELDTSSKSVVRFWVKKIDAPLLRQSENWTPSKRILLFEFDNGPRELKLRLYIGPGPSHLREKLYEIARTKKPLKPLDAFRPKWNAIFNYHFVRAESYEKPEAEFEEIVNKQWLHFLETDLPAIVAIVEAERWIFDEPVSNSGAVSE